MRHTKMTNSGSYDVGQIGLLFTNHKLSASPDVFTSMLAAGLWPDRAGELALLQNLCQLEKLRRKSASD